MNITLPIQVKPFLEEPETSQIRAKWFDLAEKLNIPNEEAVSIYDRLYYEYSDWDRAYHNLSHIKSFLALSDTYAQNIERKNLFDLAIWFHDAVYNTKKKDNELQSAQLARELLMPFLEVDEVKFIQQLILSTEGHKPRLKHPDNLLFLDFDLAILATEWSTYSKYSDAIEQEYKKWYSFFLYGAGRRKVLKHFLEREEIYFSEAFKANYEDIARANLEREITILSGK
ncbi:MAG: hypothetical protein GY810_06765 [Aureispira sp.]|nr:hypothetical protein [Aureispira sp.]